MCRWFRYEVVAPTNRDQHNAIYRSRSKLTRKYRQMDSGSLGGRILFTTSLWGYVTLIAKAASVRPLGNSCLPQEETGHNNRSLTSRLCLACTLQYCGKAVHPQHGLSPLEHILRDCEGICFFPGEWSVLLIHLQDTSICTMHFALGNVLWIQPFIILNCSTLQRCYRQKWRLLLPSLWGKWCMGSPSTFWCITVSTEGSQE